MNNYRGVIKVLEACLLFLIIGIISECVKSNEGPGNSGNSNTLAPSVSFTDPADGDTAVPINATVIASFGEDLDSTTVTATTFILQQGAVPVEGVVSYADGVVIFSPASNLAANTVYTAEIEPGVTDQAGNELTTPIIWTFTTGAVHDTIGPRVNYTFPSQGDTAVALNINPTVTFSELMDYASITATTFTVKQDAAQISGRVAFNGTTAIFTPATNLSPNTTYTAEISVNAKDVTGNPLENAVVWTFKTGEAQAAGPAPAAPGTAAH